MKLHQKLLSFCFAAIMVFSMNLTSFAANDNHEKNNKIDPLNQFTPGVTISNEKDYVVYSITNPSILAKLSDEKVLPQKIELIYYPFNKTPVSNQSSARLFETYEARNVTYHGDGWYNSRTDQIFQADIDGPDTLVLNRSFEYFPSINCSISGAIGSIEAELGFSESTKYSFTIESETPVLAHQMLRAELFQTFHKYSFDLYEKPNRGDWSKVGNYEAYEPAGLYLKKEFFNK